MVAVVELDYVVACHVGRSIELVAQRRVEPSAEFFATGEPAAHAHVFGEQSRQRVDLAHVEGQAILRDQLSDLVERSQSIYSRGEIFGSGSRMVTHDTN